EWRFLHGMDLPKKTWGGRVLVFAHLQPNQFMQVYLRFQPTIASHCKFFAGSKDSLVSPMDVHDIAHYLCASREGSRPLLSRRVRARQSNGVKRIRLMWFLMAPECVGRDW